MVGETLPDVLQIEMVSGLAWSHTHHASDLLASCKHSIFHLQPGHADGGKGAIYRWPAIVAAMR
ncbi:hypothetical protein N7533_000615 [Penicillium manginii]|uniref:uncharacterized protein n=1 Tax=Penicillium manginii TaxID=203109 RepID=UPI00254997EA|nr:uncharacterized protein N7533_000615 [Penicillium manginii]KAJ5768032.1 hypothetical protein N7533_000615 [Penicillium manginii]